MKATMAATDATQAASAGVRPPTVGQLTSRATELQAPLWTARAALARAAELDTAETTEISPAAREASWLRYSADGLLKQLSADLAALASGEVAR
jgi:hypothetical protein